MMIWFLYGLILAVALTLQSVVAPFVQIYSARPDFLLVGVVFLALHGPVRETILAAWIVGLGADLLTIEQFGFLGFSYALVAFLVLEVREYLFRSRATTQFGVTAVVAIFIQSCWATYAFVRYGTHDGLAMTIATVAIPASLYTATWAVLMHRAMMAIGRPLGLGRSRSLSARSGGSGRAGLVRRGYV